MNVINECRMFTPESVKKIEERYNAKYVFESCLKNRDGGWVNFPAAIFYTKEPHPEGSNYFAMYFDDAGSIFITDAKKTVDTVHTGIKTDKGILYSRYRHDYREVDGKFIDGGRDYLRYGGGSHIDQDDLVEFTVKDGELVIMEK